jgi:hypothetical protein
MEPYGHGYDTRFDPMNRTRQRYPDVETIASNRCINADITNLSATICGFTGHKPDLNLQYTIFSESNGASLDKIVYSRSSVLNR